jgi:hypothetical protein
MSGDTGVTQAQNTPENRPDCRGAVVWRTAARATPCAPPPARTRGARRSRLSRHAWVPVGACANVAAVWTAVGAAALRSGPRGSGRHSPSHRQALAQRPMDARKFHWIRRAHRAVMWTRACRPRQEPA